ncbi:MAG TPA: 50S ribosomal protein L23 [Chloroflexota bacterium]|nr:50S ribosomal protein L23 [Chloroflexota bacterium]
MEAADILLAPIITEKSNDLGNPVPGHGPNAKNHAPANKYVFRVSRAANKIQIRKAVEERFNVHVVGVNTIHMPSKERGAGYVRINKKRRGYQPAWKKAIVTLRAGEKIEDFFGAV